MNDQIIDTNFSATGLNSSQYDFQNNLLKLKTKKSPLIPRALMFFFSFVSFILPLLSLILTISTGGKFHIGFLISIGLFGLIGFYLLRVALWNTYGSEEIHFSNNNVTYEANYGWFKDAKKTKEIHPLVFSIKSVGYEDEKKGVLIIGENESMIECVTKIPIDELEGLVAYLVIHCNK